MTKPDKWTSLAARGSCAVAKGSRISQFIRFCVTGGINSGVSFVSYYLLVRLGVLIGLSYALSYLLGMATSLLLNSKWTFAVKQVSWGMVLKFTAANLAVMALGEGFLHFIVGMLHFPAAYGQLATLVPTTLINFGLSRYWVFRGTTPACRSGSFTAG